jgi:hypothetical protein
MRANKNIYYLAFKYQIQVMGVELHFDHDSHIHPHQALKAMPLNTQKLQSKNQVDINIIRFINFTILIGFHK